MISMLNRIKLKWRLRKFKVNHVDKSYFRVWTIHNDEFITDLVGYWKLRDASLNKDAFVLLPIFRQVYGKRPQMLDVVKIATKDLTLITN